jgi:hypothetical protein
MVVARCNASATTGLGLPAYEQPRDPPLRDDITASEYGWVLFVGSTIVVLVVATFGVPASVGWNWARPVPEGDRSSCTNRLIVTVSFPGRACHPLNR